MKVNINEPLLKVRFDGISVGPGRIPVAHLLKFLGNLNKALQRTGRILKGAAESTRQGRPPQQIKEEIDLDLVLLTEGSPAAVLGFERRQTEPLLPQMDFGMEILEKSIRGLDEVQTMADEAPLPNGFDAGVLMAWRDVGHLLFQGVERIEVTLNHRSAPLTTAFTLTGYERIQQRIKGPQTNIRTIEGRLLMADFKEHGTRCRIHPSAGEPVLCLFDEEQKDEVLDDMLQYVRIVGEAKEDSFTGRIASIKIHDIQRLEGCEDKAVDLLPQGTPISRNFWESPSLDELALSQNVQPLTNVRNLFGTWPGDDDDGFEVSIDDLRHLEVSGGRER